MNFASDRAGAERVVAEIGAAGGKAFAIQANVSVVAEVERMLAEAVAHDEARAAHIARTPLGRVGTPADIASVAVFLACDEARWVTGECLAVSRGLR